MFTPAQQADANRQERDRRDLEDRTILALLLFASRARRAAFDSLRLGYDPAQAVARVFYGDARSAQPGVLPTIRRQMAKAHGLGQRRVMLDVARRTGVVVTPAPTPTELLQHDAWVMGEVRKITDGFAQAFPHWLRNGAPARTALREAFQSVGLWPDAVTPGADGDFAMRGLGELVTGVGYNDGRDAALDHPAVAAEVWGLTWRTMRDNRVRPTHRQMEGVTRPTGDAVWQLWSPPAGWGCRCVRVIRYNRENPVETAVPNVMPDEGFAGLGNLTLVA